MSQIHERQYRLAREREIAAARVRQTTQEYVYRYESILSDLEEQGLVEFVQNDYMRLRVQLNEIKQSLSDNPFRARDVSISMGHEVHALPRNARSIKRETEHAEHQAYLKDLKEKEEQERRRHSNLLKVWQQELSSPAYKVLKTPVQNDLSLSIAFGVVCKSESSRKLNVLLS